MKKENMLDALRQDVWTQVMVLPVAYNDYIYDEKGVSFNKAVTTLVDRLTEMHMQAQGPEASASSYRASDVARIVGQIKCFIDSAPGKVSSYDERIGAYILDIS